MFFSRLQISDLSKIHVYSNERSVFHSDHELGEEEEHAEAGGDDSDELLRWRDGLSRALVDDIVRQQRRGRVSVNDPGWPPGIVLNASTSFWLPVPPKHVFDFLCDETSRSEVPEEAGVVGSKRRSKRSSRDEWDGGSEQEAAMSRRRLVAASSDE
ncbi:hypothetical protein GUJ93_ZPchr0007g3450 [Zizania palustris]|uniref:HD-Zip IV C-terminal domain-containing protein n=1 Tax=Zizania palustris TaxID=103762 RepID=A0A8J5T4V8_ZIZPA|nr:hypothetical protein GUJ93_ZPchr0007g3450 [Zizania palustris]